MARFLKQRTCEKEPLTVRDLDPIARRIQERAEEESFRDFDRGVSVASEYGAVRGIGQGRERLRGMGGRPAGVNDRKAGIGGGETGGYGCDDKGPIRAVPRPRD